MFILATASSIAEHSKQVAGVNFCIYHKGPGTVEIPNDYIMEVCFPMK